MSDLCVRVLHDSSVIIQYRNSPYRIHKFIMLLVNALDNINLTSSCCNLI